VVHAVRGCVEHMLNALHGEVIVCLHGVQEVIKQGIGATTIEIDALQVLGVHALLTYHQRVT
jgi:hypothetical protein